MSKATQTGLHFIFINEPPHDIHLLLDVEVHPSGIQQMLEERKMYAEVVELYLENGSDARAISISNFALDEQDLEKYAVSLVDVLWDKALENYHESLVENIASKSKLWLLLHLFWDPALASKSSDFGSQCISNLGPQIVEVAVLKKTPPEKAGDLLRAFDPERFAQYGKKDNTRPNQIRRVTQRQRNEILLLMSSADSPFIIAMMNGLAAMLINTCICDTNHHMEHFN